MYIVVKCFIATLSRYPFSQETVHLFNFLFFVDIAYSLISAYLQYQQKKEILKHVVLGANIKLFNAVHLVTIRCSMHQENSDQFPVSAM